MSNSFLSLQSFCIQMFYSVPNFRIQESTFLQLSLRGSNQYFGLSLLTCSFLQKMYQFYEVPLRIHNTLVCYMYCDIQCALIMHVSSFQSLFTDHVGQNRGLAVNSVSCINVQVVFREDFSEGNYISMTLVQQAVTHILHLIVTLPRQNEIHHCDT